MMDGLSRTCAALLSGAYDCLDRIVLNAYFRFAQNPGGFRVWWRQLQGEQSKPDNASLLRMAGRFQRQLTLAGRLATKLAAPLHKLFVSCFHLILRADSFSTAKADHLRPSDCGL